MLAHYFTKMLTKMNVSLKNCSVSFHLCLVDDMEEQKSFGWVSHSQTKEGVLIQSNPPSAIRVKKPPLYTSLSEPRTVWGLRWDLQAQCWRVQWEVENFLEKEVRFCPLHHIFHLISSSHSLCSDRSNNAREHKHLLKSTRNQTYPIYCEEFTLSILNNTIKIL